MINAMHIPGTLYLWACEDTGASEAMPVEGGNFKSEDMGCKDPTVYVYDRRRAAIIDGKKPSDFFR